jgi:hypothetical protein
MKSRADCDCLCHSRGIVLHVVQCCDGIASLLPKTPTPVKPAQMMKGSFRRAGASEKALTDGR